jgi:hypothetical protein
VNQKEGQFKENLKLQNAVCLRLMDIKKVKYHFIRRHIHMSLPKETHQACKIPLESEMVTNILSLSCVDLIWNDPQGTILKSTWRAWEKHENIS